VLDAVIAAWTALGQASGLTTSANLYAAVSAAHVLGIALLLGPIMLVDLSLLGRVRRLDADALTLLRTTARIGVGLAMLTGILLASTRPAEYLANRVFLTKLFVIAIGLANALAFEWLTRRDGLMTTAVSPAATRAAAISIIAWIATLALGRWIAFV
jgi:hypothetical protein